MAEHRACIICGSEAALHFEHTVMGRHRARYFHCHECDCIFVASPHWLSEAYETALNVFDTGALSRNIALARRLTAILYLHCGPDERYLDYAAGYGVLVRLMRDVGFDYYWEDPYAQNLLARGFECVDEGPFAAISAFEVLEHLTDPSRDLARLAKRSDTLVLSTELWHGRPPLPDEWWYFGFEHGQHVTFYARRTLSYLAAKFGYRLVTDGKGFHVFTRRPDPCGVVEQSVTRQRVRRADVRACVTGVKKLALPPFFVTGTLVSVARIEKAIRRRMKSLTLTDHEMLRARFAEGPSAHRSN